MAIPEAILSFLHPGLALAAVLVAALPVVLHLLLRRPKVTAWPSTMLLQRALDRMRRRRTLDRWLLLALRTLALLLIGLGMSGPFVGASEAGPGARRLWIVIDDGATSAERLPSGGTSLDRSIREAVRRVDQLHEGDQAAVAVAGRPSRVLVQPTTDLQRVRRAVQDLVPRAVPTDLPGAMALTPPVPEDTMPVDVLLASGWRRGTIRGSEAALGSLTQSMGRVRWIATTPLEIGADNRRLARAQVDRTVAQSLDPRGRILKVQVARTGARSATTDAIRVALPTGEVINQTPLAWSADTEEMESVIDLRQTDAGAATVSMPPDAQPLDDACAVTWEPQPVPRVWLVGRSANEETVDRTSATTWILRAIESTGLNPLVVDPASLALRSQGGADAIVVGRPDLIDAAGWAWLSRFLSDGGTLLLMPAAERAEQPWLVDASRSLRVDLAACGSVADATDQLSPRQPRTELLSLLGAEVDQLAEPVSVSRRLDLKPLSASGEVILRFDDGAPAMIMLREASTSGTLLMMAMPPDLSWTDLPLKPLMVPLMQETVRAGMSMSANRRRLMVAQVASLGPSASGGLLIPATSTMGPSIEIDGEGRSRSVLPSPGLWKLRKQDGSEAWYAVRLDPADADIGTLSRSDLLSWEQALGEWTWSDEPVMPSDGTTRTESPWTWSLVLIGLLCLLIETPWSRRGSPRRTMEAVGA